MRISKNILFTAGFIFSLSGIQIASFKDWLIISLVIQVIWISITANNLCESVNTKTSFQRIIQSFNKKFIYLLVADGIIIFLSMSFGFRILFAAFYQPIYYITMVCIINSVVGNYYEIINYLIKKQGLFGKNYY